MSRKPIGASPSPFQLIERHEMSANRPATKQNGQIQLPSFLSNPRTCHPAPMLQKMNNDYSSPEYDYMFPIEETHPDTPEPEYPCVDFHVENTEWVRDEPIPMLPMRQIPEFSQTHFF